MPDSSWKAMTLSPSDPNKAMLILWKFSLRFFCHEKKSVQLSCASDHTWPTTHVNLRKSMTPQMFRRHLMYTPSIQPNLMTFPPPPPVPSAVSPASKSRKLGCLFASAADPPPINSSKVGRPLRRDSPLLLQCMKIAN